MVRGPQFERRWFSVFKGHSVTRVVTATAHCQVQVNDMGIFVDTVSSGTGFSSSICFPVLVAFHPRTILIFIFKAILNRTNGQSLETIKKKVIFGQKLGTSSEEKNFA